MLTAQDISSEGFRDIKFHHFRSKCSPLDFNSMKRLLSFTHNLEMLEVSKMQKLEADDRQVLSSLVINIIELAPTLKHLSLDEFYKKNKDPEHPEQGIEILQTLLQQD